MLKFYNTLSGRKEKFLPLKKTRVSFYACGPTVYDFAHLGNLRTYLFEDFLRRVLEFNGFRVKQVMNITDIDDKIIKRAKQKKTSIKKLSSFFTRCFFEDIQKLNIKPAAVYPRATDHIKEMIVLIKQLLDRGFAYQGKNKSIYFSIQKFKDYGQLSNLKQQSLKIGSRIEADEYNKENAQDFALWKASQPDEPYWPSPFGQGRPGWHIECSAMSMKHLGKTLDIHTGGVDNIFPHHENEIAQSEAASGKKFVNFWLHAEHLLVNGQKMAKSLNNFYTLADLENRGISALAFRYLSLTSHYRAKLNFTWQAVQSAENSLDRLYSEIIRLRLQPLKKTPGRQAEEKQQKMFFQALNDDLNLPKALAVLWSVLQSPKLDSAQKIKLIKNFDKVLGLNLSKIKTPRIPIKIKQLVAGREKFRTNQQFIQADNLRKKIESLGYKIEDTPRGPLIFPLYKKPE